jgi:uncharacterized membrane protein YkoI
VPGEVTTIDAASDGGGSDGGGTGEQNGDETSAEEGEASAGDTDADSGALAADADLRTEAPAVDAEQAIEVALQEVGDQTVYAIELEYDMRAQAWQWEVGVLEGATDHEVTIDATTGEVVEHQQEPTDDQEQAIDLASPMTFQEALDLAAAEVDAPLTGWKLEWDDGAMQYQFEFAPGQDDVDVVVDTASGKVWRD